MHYDEYCKEPPTSPADDNAGWVCDHECDLETCLIVDNDDFLNDCPEWNRLMAQYE